MKLSDFHSTYGLAGSIALTQSQQRIDFQFQKGTRKLHLMLDIGGHRTDAWLTLTPREVKNEDPYDLVLDLVLSEPDINVVEPAPEPVVEVKAEPVVEVKAEPVVEVKAEPVVEVKAEPVVEVKAEPVVETKKAPESNPEPSKKVTTPAVKPAK